MAKETLCIKNYYITCGEIINGKNEVTNELLFENGKTYYFYNQKEIFYVAKEKKYMKDISRFNIFIEEMNEKEFTEYFSSEFRYKDRISNEIINFNIFSNWVKVYNKLTEKLLNNDEFDKITEIEKMRLKQANKMLGFESFIIDSVKERKMKNNFKK